MSPVVAPRERSPSTAVGSSANISTLLTSQALVVSFWEPGGYKPTLRRINDTNHLCNDFISLVSERLCCSFHFFSHLWTYLATSGRKLHQNFCSNFILYDHGSVCPADIEAKYASMLRKYSEKWNALIDKGPEYGSMQSCWKSVLIACDRLAAVHTVMYEEMLNVVVANIKQWQKQNLVKQVLTRDLKFKRETEDEFKRAQKQWEKLLREVADTKADYFYCCQKEKSSIVRERNVAKDQAVSVEQRGKYEEETHKLTEVKQRARDKYARAVRELAYATPKYRDDMYQVFNKCQEREGARMNFFKKMFFRLHECLDLSARPHLDEIFSEFQAQISKGDGEADLRWWEKTWGPAMPMAWPTEFEEYRDEAAQKNITGNANNQAKLNNIVPLSTNSPLKSSAAMQSSTSGTPADPQLKNTELLAQQATALMHSVRPIEPALSPQQLATAAKSTSATLNPHTASNGIALTSYQEHCEILPTIRCKPKQARAEGSRPWTAATSNNTVDMQSQHYDFVDVPGRAKNKNEMRPAYSEYQLNSNQDENNFNEIKSSSKSAKPLHQIRRSRGSVAERPSSPPINSGADARRRASVIDNFPAQQQHGKTLPASASLSMASTTSSASSSSTTANARSSTLYCNNNNNSIHNSDFVGDTPPPTYEQHGPIKSSDFYEDDKQQQDHQNDKQEIRQILSSRQKPTTGRAHAVAAIGHAAGKRYVYENTDALTNDDNMLEQRRFDAAGQPVEPFDNVIAEIHDKLTKAGRPVSHHHNRNNSHHRHRSDSSTSRTDNNTTHVQKSRPKIQINNNNSQQYSRKSRSRSRSRQRSNNENGSLNSSSARQRREHSSSSRDRATNTEAIFVASETTQTVRHNTEAELTVVGSETGSDDAAQAFATSGNVRAKIKSFTAAAPKLSSSNNASSSFTQHTTPNSTSRQPVESENRKTATSTKFITSTHKQQPSDNFSLQQQQQPQQAVSPESGAASSIDSENGGSALATAAGVMQPAQCVVKLTTFSSSSNKHTHPTAVKKQPEEQAGTVTAKATDSTKTTTINDDNNGWESESADSALNGEVDRSSKLLQNGGAHAVCMVKAVYDYNAEEADEISLRSGEVLAKTHNEDAQGWCKGRKRDGREGLFPASFVVEIK